jgi:hypothetical protein
VQTVTDVNDTTRLTEFVAAVANRCLQEPDLDDFLLWNTESLEYWLHVLISSAGHTIGWAPRTTVPYLTAYSAPNGRLTLLRADGAVVWPDGLAAIVEVKTVPMRASLSHTIEQLPQHMAALAATDWAATTSQARDLSADAGWWLALKRIERPWGLVLALLHGDRTSMKNCSPLVRAGIKRGLAGVHDHFPGPARWLATTDASFEKPLHSVAIDGHDAAAVLLAWAAPIFVGP